MPSEIVWLPGASRDVARLRNFIKSENPRAAQRAAKRVIEGANILIDNPEAGVPVEGFIDYRELTLTFGAGEYIIWYRLESKRKVVIARFRHSNRLL